MQLEIGYPTHTEAWELEPDMDERKAYAFGQALLTEDPDIQWMLLTADGDPIEELHRVDTLAEFGTVCEKWLAMAYTGAAEVCERWLAV